jgi:hypothetical protein
MRGSPADVSPLRRPLRAVLLGAVLGVSALSALSALAQTNAPLRLTPVPAPSVTVEPSPSVTVEPSLPPTAPPESTFPAPAANAPVRLTPGSPQPRLDAAPGETTMDTGSIKVRPLGAPDADEAGLLRADTGALPEDLWAGSTRSEIATFLEALPAPMISPAQRTLALRLLMSGGTPPDAPAGSAGRRFGAIRVEKIAALGAAREARALASRLPGVLADEPAALALTRAELVAGTYDCAKGAETVRAFESDVWRRLDVLCRAQRGDRDSAQVGLDMLRERGEVDPAFEAAVEKLAGQPTPAAATVALPDAVTLTALRLAGFPVPPEALAKVALTDLPAVARNPAVDPLQRAIAAEKAAAAQLIDAKELLTLYAALPTQADDPLHPVEEAGRDPGPRARAAAINAMAGAIDGRRRADLAATAARLVPPAWRAGPVGIAGVSLLDGINATAANGALAPLAVKLYAAQGQTAKAGRWYQALATNDRLRKDAIRLWPLAMLADAVPEGGYDLDVDTWLDAEARVQPPSRTLTLVPVLQALGVAVPAETAERVAAQTTLVAAPDVVNRLSRASGEGRLGETALIALDLLGDGGPAQVQPGVLARVADAFVANGLEREARAIVREAAAALTE